MHGYDNWVSVFSIRSHQTLNWFTEVKCLSPMGEEMILSLRVPIFAMLPLQTSRTFLEYKEIQSPLHTSPP